MNKQDESFNRRLGFLHAMDFKIRRTVFEAAKRTNSNNLIVLVLDSEDSVGQEIMRTLDRLGLVEVGQSKPEGRMFQITCVSYVDSLRRRIPASHRRALDRMPTGEGIRVLMFSEERTLGVVLQEKEGV